MLSRYGNEDGSGPAPFPVKSSHLTIFGRYRFLLDGQSPRTDLPILRAVSSELWVWVLSYKAQIRTASLSVCALFVRFHQPVGKRILLEVIVFSLLASRNLKSHRKMGGLFIGHLQELPELGLYKCHRGESKVYQ